MNNNALKKCPYCSATLVLKNNLLFCPQQGIFMGKPGDLSTLKAKTRPRAVIENNAIEDPGSNRITTDDTASEIKTPMSLSGFWRRFLSILMDAILIGIVMSLVMSILENFINFNTFATDSIDTVITAPWKTVILPVLLRAIPTCVFIVIYFTIFESIWGATIGKFVTGERVVDLNGGKASFPKIFLRNLFKPIDAFFSLGYLVFLFSSRNQIIGDKIAGTLVIQKNPYATPIKGAPISVLRKFFGILYILTFVGAAVATIALIPVFKTAFSQFDHIRENGYTILYALKEANKTGETAELYNLFSPEFQNDTPYDEFVEVFKNPDWALYLDALDIDAFEFTDVNFENRAGTISGREVGEAGAIDGIVYAEIHFLQNENNKWETTGFYINFE